MLLFGAADDTGAPDDRPKTEMRKKMLGLRSFGHYKKVPGLRTLFFDRDKNFVSAFKGINRKRDDILR